MQGLTHFLLAFLGAFLFGGVAYLCGLKAICLCSGRTGAETLSSEVRAEGAMRRAREGPPLGDALGEQNLTLRGKLFLPNHFKGVV